MPCSEMIQSNDVYDFIVSSDERNTPLIAPICVQSINRNYDIIIGSVADDDVFKTVDMYFRGLWDKEKVLHELRYYKMNDQICIVNQKTLEEVLKFKESHEAK